jgi:ribosomal protein L11 methyltransferase
VKLGGEAFGVDVDADAIAIATANARRNGSAPRATFSSTWPEGTFDVVVANIRLDVLLALAPSIVARLRPTATLILAGLVSTDVPSITAGYAPRLGGARPEIFERDEWRAVVWRIYDAPNGS